MTGRVRASVVVLTYNRRHELDRTLRRLSLLPERPHVIVVDNASSDGTAAFVQQAHPQVDLVRCEVNLGAAGRNLGVARVRTPYVAFCDDDTWWAAGALSRAEGALDAHPRLAVVAARVLVGPQETPDPNCERMAASPLDGTGLPGPRLAAFMAGAAVMRVEAYWDVAGYEPRLFLGAEEALMAIDFAARGWDMAYLADAILHHHPSAVRDAPRRKTLVLRNRIWIAWMRLPCPDALAETVSLLCKASRQRQLWQTAWAAAAGIGWAFHRRQVVPAPVSAMWRTVFRRNATASAARGLATARHGNRERHAHAGRTAPWRGHRRNP